MNEKIQYVFKTYLPGTLLLMLICFPLFKDLGTQSLRMWDESRLAINAYEMYHNHRWLTTHYGEIPDLWNTKPPFMIWMQVISMKLFGINEFAIRFPSAFAALLIVMTLLFFLAKKFNNLVLFSIMSMILVTSRGFVGHHVTRTGDYDSLLILFTSLFTICFFIFTGNKRTIYLYLTFLFISFAVLTKSIVGLIFLPGIFLYVIYKRQLMSLLKNLHFYIGILMCILIVGGFYFLREWQNPGYLKAVYVNELGGRYLDAKELHRHGILFYYYQIFEQFTPWYILAGAGALMGIFSKEDKIRDFTFLNLFIVIVFLTVISTAETKLIWYIAPLFPSFAFFASIPLFYLYKELTSRIDIIEGFWNKYIPILVLILVFIIPYIKIFSSFETTREQAENQSYYYLSDYLRTQGNRIPDHTVIVYDANTLSHVQFYMNKLQEEGKNISLYTFPAFDSCNSVLVGQNFFHDIISNYFNHEIIEDQGMVKRYKISGRYKKGIPYKVEFKEEFSSIHVYEYKSTSTEQFPGSKAF